MLHTIVKIEIKELSKTSLFYDGLFRLINNDFFIRNSDGFSSCVIASILFMMLCIFLPCSEIPLKVFD